LRPLKRPDLVIDLSQALPDVSFQMIGGPMPGYSDYYTQMSNRAARLSNLTFRGPVPYHAVSGEFGRARIFVNTSEIEGFPNTYLQAWIHGTPVVSFFDPDGVINREGLGKAVSTNDEMAAAVLEIVGNPNLWRQMSARCLAYMTRDHGEDEVIAPYIAAIESVAT